MKRKLTAKEIEDQEFSELMDIKADIQLLFAQFASQKHGYMDSPLFRKFLLTSNLLPDMLAINEVDILYMTAKARYKESQSACGLTFEAFAHALLLIAQSIHDQSPQQQARAFFKGKNIPEYHPKSARTGGAQSAESKLEKEKNKIFTEFI